MAAKITWDNEGGGSITWDDGGNNAALGREALQRQARFNAIPFRTRLADYLHGASAADPNALMNAGIRAKQAGDTAGARQIDALYRETDRRANDPTKGMSGAELLKAGGIMSVARTGRGLGQLVGIVSEEDEARARELEAPLADTGLGFTGNVLGGVAQVVTPGAAFKGAAMVPQLSRAAPALNAASTAFIPRTVPGAGLSGAAFGAVQPVTAGESRLANAAFGGAFGVAGAGAPRVFRNVTRAVSGPRAKAADIIREGVPNADEVVAGAVPSRVPGVQRTLAEATLNPDVVNLDRGYRSVAGTRLSAQEAANNQRRVDQLMRIAGTEDELQAAISAREVASAPLRRDALQAERIDITGALARLSALEGSLRGNPSVQSAVSRINGLLKDALRKEPDRPAGAILDSSGNPITPAVRGGPIGADMQQLYNIRKEIGLMLSGSAGGDNAQAIRQSRELMVARDLLDSAIARRVPQFREYLDTYKSMSGDINRLQFGQELSRVALAGAEGVTPTLQPGAFMRATQGIGTANPRNGANALAARATGFRKARADQVLPTADVDTLRAIREDVTRIQEVQRIASRNAGGNSQTALLQQLQSGVLRRLSNRAPFVGDLLSVLDERAKERVAEAVSDALANPEQARQILSRFPANQRPVVARVFGSAGLQVEPLRQQGAQNQRN